MREIKPEQIQQFLNNEQIPKAVLKRLWDTNLALGRNFLNVVGVDFNQGEFFIPEPIFRGAGWLRRKIKNFRFFIY